MDDTPRAVRAAMSPTEPPLRCILRLSQDLEVLEVAPLEGD